MTRRELIRLLEDSFSKYPTVPMDAKVAYRSRHEEIGGEIVYLQGAIATIVERKPVVILI